jgi:diguanylate cyclase (GGDEF)-like protein
MASQSGDGKKQQFDVFLAHNRADKFQVGFIANALKRHGLKPWLDSEQVPPGRWFQACIQEAICDVKASAILIGKNGLGRWQALELRAFISQCVEHDLPVIPVLLPEVEEIPGNLLFLKELNYIKFKYNGDREALDQLIWGITGRPPIECKSENSGDLPDALTDKMEEHHTKQQVEGLLKDLRELKKGIITYNTSLGLLFADIDRFDAINRVYGNSTGNIILNKVGQIIMKTIPHQLVVRLGGDQYVICVKLKDVDDITFYAQDILVAVRKYDWDTIAPDLYVTISVGFARHVSDESEKQWLMRSIYGSVLAKKVGGNKHRMGPMTLGPRSSNDVLTLLS